MASTTQGTGELTTPSARVPLACLAAFAAGWLALAVAPHDRGAWLLEQLGVFVALPIVLATYRRVPLSDRSYVQGTALVLLHLVGSHYGYAEVPAGRWLADVTGGTRNHFDRLVHFAYGALLLLPATEIFLRRVRASRVLGLVFAVAMVNLFSVAHELVEWLLASVAGKSDADAYLAAQGDAWDTQKDLAVTALGAALAAVVERVRRREAPEEVRR